MKNGTNRLLVFGKPGPSSSTRTSRNAAVRDPTDPDATPGFQSCIDGIVQEIDEKLFQLVAVGLNHQRRAWRQNDRDTIFKFDNSLEPLANDSPDARRVGGASPTAHSLP